MQINVPYQTSDIFIGRNEVVAKVIFLHLSVILFTGGVSASVHAEIPHPPGADTPRQQTSPGSRHPPGSRHTPWEQTHPPEQTLPWEQTPPGSRHPRSRHPPGADTPSPEQTPPRADTPPPGANTGIRSKSSRYASYWNAFLFEIIFDGI